MQVRTYNRIAGACLILGVGAAFAYEVGGEYSWIAIGAAIGISIVAASAYFAYHAPREGEEKTSDVKTVQTVLTEVVSGAATKEQERREYSVVFHRMDSNERYVKALVRLFLSERLREEEYPFEGMAQAVLRHAKSKELDEAEALLRLWWVDRDDFSGQPLTLKYSHVVASMLDARWTRTLEDVEFLGDTSSSRRLIAGEKWHRHKQNVGKKAEWRKALALGEFIGERSRTKAVH